MISGAAVRQGKLPGYSDWIDRNLQFRLGDAFDKRFYLVRERVHGGDPGNAPFLYGLDGKSNTFYDLNGITEQVNFTHGYWAQDISRYPWAIGRSCAFLNYFAKLPFECDMLLNMADAQQVDYSTILAWEARPPVFQFTRMPGQPGTALFPLQNYMEVGCGQFPDRLLDDVPWTEKRSQIVWRGFFSGNTRRDGKILLAHDCVVNAAQGRDAASALADNFASFARFRAVIKAASTDCLDARFTGWSELPERLADNQVVTELLRPMHGDPLSIRDQLGFRYLLCLEGNDYPTSLFWSLASNSLVLMPKPVWETVFHESLEPWTHYVPVAADLSDLEQRFAWCEDHQSEVLDMVAAANRYIEPYQNFELRNILDYLTIETYSRNFSSVGRYGEVNFGNDHRAGCTWTSA